MKNSYKAILLAALGLSTVSAAQAQNMLLGFTDTSAGATAHNDYVLSLGAYTQFTSSASLGGTIDAPTISSAYGSVDANYLNDVSVGAVTGANSPTKFVYQTVGFPGGLTAAAIGTGGSLVSAVSLGEYSSSSTTGWSANVEQDPTTLGANNGSTGSISGDTGFLMEYLSNGTVTEQLWSAVVSGSALHPVVTETDLGTLTVNLNNDTWGFQGAAVPEPSTYGLFAGAGLLLVGVRRQFTRKNA